MIPNEPTSTATALHYVWGENCDGWHLVRTPELAIIQERMPPGTSEARHFHHQARQFSSFSRAMACWKSMDACIPWQHGKSWKWRQVSRINFSIEAQRICTFWSSPSRQATETGCYPTRDQDRSAFLQPSVLVSHLSKIRIKTGGTPDAFHPRSFFARYVAIPKSRTSRRCARLTGATQPPRRYALPLL